MALTVEQIMAVSFPAILADKRKPANQWAENAALRVLDSMGFINHMPFGENIEVPLDYRANPDTSILVSDQDTAALVKTEVITSAVYDIAQLSSSITVTVGDEVKNPAESQKVALVKALSENLIESHDDLIEQCIFVTSTAGGVELNGLDTLVPTSGQGTVGGINATDELFWRNFSDTYVDGSDIEAAMTEAWNEAAKGTGSKLAPRVLLSGSEAHVMYESGLQSLQRFVSNEEGDGGFKALAFKSAKFIFSQYGSDNIYFLNPKSFQLCVSKSHFRHQGKFEPIPGQNAKYMMLYSALQFVTNNKSRGSVLSQ